MSILLVGRLQSERAVLLSAGGFYGDSFPVTSSKWPLYSISWSSRLQIVSWQSSSHTFVLLRMHSPYRHVLDLTTLHVYPTGQRVSD